MQQQSSLEIIIIHKQSCMYNQEYMTKIFALLQNNLWYLCLIIKSCDRKLAIARVIMDSQIHLFRTIHNKYNYYNQLKNIIKNKRNMSSLTKAIYVLFSLFQIGIPIIK